MRRGAWVLLFCVNAGLARAEVANNSTELFRSPRIRAYVTAQARSQTLLPLAQQQDRSLGLAQGCRGDFRLHIAEVEIQSPVEIIDAQANPIRGAWLARYEYTRCGQTKLYNAIFTADAVGGVARAKDYFPGRTSASTSLVNDALNIAVPLVLASASAPSCRRLLVADMRPDGGRREEDGPGDTPVLHETWTFLACGQSIDAAIRFVPTPDGGTDIAVTIPKKN